jgi:hypothetical protein
MLEASDTSDEQLNISALKREKVKFRAKKE